MTCYRGDESFVFRAPLHLDSVRAPWYFWFSPRVQSNLYGIIDTLIQTFKRGEDFKFDEERNGLVDSKGAHAAEAFLAIPNLYDPQYRDLVPYQPSPAVPIKTLLGIKTIVIHPNVEGQPEIILLDQATGRLMEMTRLRRGLHQAIEAKRVTSSPKKHGPWLLYLPKPL